MNSKLDEVRSLVNKLIGNAAVESFGVHHQVLFLEFRNDLPEDSILSINTEVESNIHLPAGLTIMQEILLIFSSINLQIINKIHLDEKSNLTLLFENNVSVKISGTPKDMSSEPWQLASRTPTGDGGCLIIANYSGGFATWDGSI